MTSLRIILHGLKITLAALLLLISLVLTTTSTETGSRWLIRQVLSSQPQIKIAKIEGALLNRLSLRQLHYQGLKGFEVSIEQITLQWRFLELLTGHLHIAALTLNGIDIEGSPPEQESNQNNSTIPTIPLTVALDALTIENVIWRNESKETKLDKLALAATLIDNKLRLSNLQLDLPDAHIEGQSSVQLQSDWPVTAALDWSYTVERALLRGQTQLTGTMRRYQFDNRITVALESGQHGFVTFIGPTPEFNVTVDWKTLQWPLNSPPQFQSEHGQFQLQGTTQHYRINLKADIAALDQPTFPLALTGDGNLDGITIASLLLQPADSRLELKGQLNWQPSIDFNLALTAEKLDPTDFGADVPGQLDIKLQSQGHINSDQYDIALNIEQLAGKLFDQAVHGEGRLKLVNRQLDIDRFELSAGDNHVLASGNIDEQQADLDLQIDANNLRTAWPTLTGKLHGGASIKGPLQHARIKSSLKGRNLRFEDYQINSLSLALDYTHDSQQHSKLDLTAQNLHLAGNGIDRIALQGGGKPLHHDFLLRLDGPSLSLNLDGHGQWSESLWQAQLSRLSIDHPTIKQWRLASPSQISIDASDRQNLRIDLTNSCLQQNAAELCVSVHGSPTQQLDGSFTLVDLSLSVLQGELPPDVTINGILSAQGEFSKRPNDMDANLSITLPSGQVRFKDEDNIAYEQAIGSSRLAVEYRQDRLQGQLQLGLGKEDFVRADVATGKLTDGNGRLSGTVKAQVADMSLIDSLMPEISRLQGTLSTDLQLGGTVEQPLVIGSAQWSNARFDIPRLGIQLDDILIKADSDANNSDRLLLSLAAQSGKGKLTGQGHLDLQTSHRFPLQLTLTGNQFQITRLPEAEIVVSPNLSITKYDTLTHIDGQINIDSANVELNTAPESAIAPSADEEIVSADQPNKKTIDPERLNTKIAIDFGDNSHFEGFGLKTKLAGKLEYLITPEQQRMQGRAAMQDASYKAYGQDLTIRKGEFLFNGPADNPWLNIEAIRKAVNDDVTAVLNVTGPLKSPETKVYTEPSLPESEALSYLVTGKSTQWLGKGDSSSLANAAFNYGAGQLSWLSDRLGIDEFSFEQGDTIQDSAVKLGQYLNPDLYVGVTMGLFSNKYAANLKYRLTKHFSVSTKAGESQRIDLNYQFETD